MIIPNKLVDAYIKEWLGAGKQELRSRLKSLESKRISRERLAEIKAIQALLN